MNIGVRELENSKVYRYGEDEPWGIVRKACLNRETNRLEALAVDTCSLIPLRRIIGYEYVECIRGKSIFLKKGCISSPAEKSVDKVLDMATFGTAAKPRERLRDLSFDTETGEITDVVVSRNKITKKRKIPINKIYIKDNTIYIKKQGGNDNE